MEWLSRGIEVLIHAIRSNPSEARLFDVVVVGSGYGGSVAAARLAGAAKKGGGHVSLCLLERGKEYLPGEFPNHMRDFPGHVRVDQHDKEEIYGRPDALFDYRSNPDVNVLVGNALGGGSIINAAVALPANAEVFSSHPWPAEFHADQHYLDRWYARAADMLGVEYYPDNDDKPRLPKLGALKELAQSYSRWPYTPPKYTFPELRHYMNGEPIRGLGVSDPPRRRSPEFKRLPLAITFDRPNAQGVKQSRCLECGDCCSGCNYWAKNTLTMNYLPAAYRRGAQIYTGAKVLRVLHADKSTGKRWRVEFIRTAYEKEHSGAQAPQASDTSAAQAVNSVLADIVILAAGTLGSTEILLKSKRPARDTKPPKAAVSIPPVADDALLTLSDNVGTRFSCNGDMISVGYGQSQPVYPVGCGAETPQKRRHKTGPMATGMIDFRRADNDGCPILIEDGAIPGVLKRLYGEIITTAGLIAQFIENDLKDDGKNDPLAVSDRLVEASQVYLLMGLDSASGRLSVDRIRGRGFGSDFKRTGISVHWPDAANTEPVYAVQRKLMQQVRALGGIPMMSPLWEILPEKLTKVLEGRPPEGKLITVHPLGGCPMGDDEHTGAVNHMGEVFDAREATSVHEGLFVCDGSVIPTALAVNPLLTITALAERNIGLLAERCKWDTDAPDRWPLPEPCRPEPYREDAPHAVELTLRERLTGVLRDLQAGAVSDAFGLPEGCDGFREPDDIEGTARPLGVRTPKSDEHHRVTIDLKAPISDLDQFLRDPHHQVDRLEVSRLMIDRQRLIPSSGVKGRRPEGFKGTFAFLVREPSARPERVYRSLRHWWRTRGHASGLIKERPYLTPVLENFLTDAKNRYGNDERGFDVSVIRSLGLAKQLHQARKKAGDTEAAAARDAFEDEVLGVLRVANQTGERRRFIYEIQFTGADQLCYTLRGEKLLRYAPEAQGGVASARATDSINPWRSIAELKTELIRTQSDGKQSRVAEGELLFDFVDMARNSNRWPQITSETDAPSAFLALGSLALFFARVLAQTYFWTFRVPYDLKKESDRAESLDALPAQYGFSGVSFSLVPARTEDNPWECRPDATPWPGYLDGIGDPVYHWRRKAGNDRDWQLARPQTSECRRARNDAALLLTRYCGRPGESAAQQLARQPVVLIPGFAHSTRIFALPTLAMSLVEYLLDRNYDVWLLDPRTSSGLRSSWEQSELDDVALNDIPDAIRHVLHVRAREHEGKTIPAPRQVSIVAHCMGAAQFMIATLKGTLKTDGTSWIKSAVLSQVGPVAVGSASNKLRGELVALIRDQLGREYVDCRVSENDAEPLDVIADGLAATYPLHADCIDNHLPEPNNPRGFGIAVCNRITALYGHNWSHDNLNEQTHESLEKILGNANMRTFAQLVHFVQNDRLTDKDGENAYLTYLNIIQHLDFPVTLIAGEDNDVFDPATARRSFRLLKRIEYWARFRIKKHQVSMQRIAQKAVTEAQRTDLISTLKGVYAQGVQATTSPLALKTHSWQDQVRQFDQHISKLRLDSNVQRYQDSLSAAMRLAKFLDARRLDDLHSIKNYVHLDCIIGQCADQDVYPRIVAGLSGTPIGDVQTEHRLPEDRADECPEDKQGLSRVEHGWWWTRAPRAGPILGWTRIESGRLKARLWMMPEDHATRADDRVEQADAAYVESQLLRSAGNPAGSRQWECLDRVAPVRLFERVAWTDVAVDLERIHPKEVLRLRIAGMHVLPRELEERLDQHETKPGARDVPPDEAPARGDPLARLFTEELPQKPKPSSDSYIRKSLQYWKQILPSEQRMEEIEQSDILINPTLVQALMSRDTLSFVFGSCRYPATSFLNENGDEMFESIRKEIDRERAARVRPSALLLLGDQIYYDATAEIFDTEAARSKFEQRYADAFQGEKFRKLVREIPTYMGVDDHEIFEAWEPAIEHNDKRRRTRCWGIEAYKCFQQLHGPNNGTTDGGSRGLWCRFEQCGFHFFIMDARTERTRDAHDPTCANARIISKGQMKALETFLAKAQSTGTALERARPKFVASSSVLAPALRASTDHPAYAIRDDSWAGFPASRARVLGYIARHKIENVVFLAGDVHCSMVAELTYEGIAAASGSPLKSYCITASPFYSPYPFINHTRKDFACDDTFETDTGTKVHYSTRADSWVERDSFGRVDVKPIGSSRWQLDVWALERDKKKKETHTTFVLT